MASKKSKPRASKTAPVEETSFSLISNETLIALYRDLLQCRAAAAPAGFDALPAGMMMDLDMEDAVVSTHADATVRLRRRGKPKPSATAYLGAILGSALFHKTRKSGKVGVIFGEPTGAEWLDAMASAREHALPLIFVSRAKAADESETAHSKSKAAKNGHEPQGHLPRIYVDANDVVAVYRVAHESIDRARRGRGPAWIVGIPFRAEGQRRVTNAVVGMEEYLSSKGIFRPEWKSVPSKTSAK